MTDQPFQEKNTKTITVSADFLHNIVHAVANLAQYFVGNYTHEHGVGPDVTEEQSLIMQGAEYLRQDPQPQMQGIPLESGVNDCYWVIDRRCTNPAITRNKIPSAYSRDWESRQNCFYTICGAFGCGCFKFMRERYTLCVNETWGRITPTGGGGK